MTRTEDNYFSKVLDKNDTALAPMAGFTDTAFRKVCHLYSVDLMISEMISAKGLYYGNENTTDLLRLFEGESDTGVQIFGEDKDIMAYITSKYLNETNFSFIDINMGCPVKKVVGNGEGSKLMCDERKAAGIVSEIKKVSTKPVSVKTRLGFTRDDINILSFAKAMEDAGADMITIHGRTREDMFNGHARFDEIAKVKQCLSIPVIANGDVESYEDYIKVKEETGCDGVMIGRASIGNPFIFDQIKTKKAGLEYNQPTYEEKLLTARLHFDHINEYKPERVAVNEFRKHLAKYIKGMPNRSDIRQNINNAKTSAEIYQLIDTALETVR